MSETFLCQIDHFVRHPGGVFLFGWALHPRSALTSAELELTCADGTVELVAIELNKAREDVAFAFSKHPYASNSGFLAMAGLPNSTLTSAVINFVTDAGEQERSNLVIPDQLEKSYRKSLRYLLKRALAYIRLGKISVVLQKARAFRFKELIQLRNSSSASFVKRIAGKSFKLVIDHAMGGGANIYRETRVREWLEIGETVVLLTFRLDSMSYVLSVRNATGETCHSIGDLDKLSSALEYGWLQEVFFNCAVSFPQTPKLQRFILDMVRIHSAKLIVAVHDYFLVCPSNFLLDDSGHYCGIPNIKRCEQCLPAHRDGFVSLTGVRSVSAWRTIWGEVLGAASEILCFSNSSLRLFERAYPAFAGRAVVRPHPVPFMRRVNIRRAIGKPLIIGVIGSISDHKGAKVIASLSEAIVSTGAPVRIVVIGTLDRQNTSPVVEVTGPFKRDDLPLIVEQRNLDVVFLPSICPETFSFVAHEIVTMGMPLIAFDIGAQADVVRDQKIGLIVRSTDGFALLNEILNFKNSLNTGYAEVNT